MKHLCIKPFVVLILIVLSFSGCENIAEKDASRVLPVKNGTTDEAGKNGAQMNPMDLQFTLSLVDSKIVLNQPVILRFQIQNNSTKSVRIDLGRNFKEAFLFTIVLPDGKRTKLPRLVREGFSANGEIEIPSQNTYSKEILLNEWAGLKMPGSYSLEGRLSTSPQPAEQPVYLGPVFDISFSVEPEDLEHLKRTAEKLLDQLLNSRTYEEAADTALAASHVRSAVGIPFIQKALVSDKMVESVIINSLRELGGKVSVQVLTGAISEKPSSEMATQARAALRWIESHTSDAEVKSLINKRLQSELGTNSTN